MSSKKKKMNYYSIKYKGGSIAVRAYTEKEARVKFHKHTHGTIISIKKVL